MNKKMIGIFLGTLILAGGGGFYGGMQYQKSQTSAQTSGVRGSFSEMTDENMRQRVPNGEIPQGFDPSNQGNFRGGVSGKIIAKDEESITVKMEDGSSKIVFIDEDTKINLMSEGIEENLKEEVTVSAMGEENEDGSIEARSVQINN